MSCGITCLIGFAFIGSMVAFMVRSKDHSEFENLLDESQVSVYKKIVAERDRNMAYYNYTGIPYQIRGLVLNLISDYKDDNISEEEIKLWRIEDDKKYCRIAKKIMKKTNV